MEYFDKINWVISIYDTVSTTYCSNGSSGTCPCYDNKCNIIEKISMRLQWRYLLGLVEIMVDQEVSVLLRSLIGGDDGVNGQIMSAAGGHGTVYGYA